MARLSPAHDWAYAAGVGMATTRENWTRAWGHLDPHILAGDLTSRKTRGPSSATAKHLFPAVFQGDLPAAHYRPECVTRLLVDDTMFSDHLNLVVKKHEPELLALTVLVGRLKALYRAHRAGRPRVHTPNDLLMPLAREIFLSAKRRPTDTELLGWLLGEWPHDNVGWESWPANSATVATVLERSEVAQALQDLMRKMWADRPATPFDAELLDTHHRAAVAAWRELDLAPGLDTHWTALTATLTATSTDNWTTERSLTAGPVALPTLSGPQTEYLLERPVKDRLLGAFLARTAAELPRLKPFLERAAVQAAHPLGLFTTSSRAAFIIGYAATIELPIEESDGSPQTAQADPDLHPGRSLSDIMLSRLDHAGLLPRAGKASQGEEPGHPTPELTLAAPMADRLAGHVDVSGMIADPRFGPQVRLWPRLVSRELCKNPVHTADDAFRLIAYTFRSWVDDVRAGRWRGAQHRHTNHHQDHGPTLHAEVLSIIKAGRQELLAAYDQAEPTDGSEPNIGPFQELWERLVPPTDDNALNISWQEALNLIRNHLGRS